MIVCEYIHPIYLIVFLPSAYLAASNVLQKFIVNVISNRLNLFFRYILYFMGSLTEVAVDVGGYDDVAAHHCIAIVTVGAW